MQVRVSETQELPQVTEEAWYAVALLPSFIVPPQGNEQVQTPSETPGGVCSMNELPPVYHSLALPVGTMRDRPEAWLLVTFLQTLNS